MFIIFDLNLKLHIHNSSKQTPAWDRLTRLSSDLHDPMTTFRKFFLFDVWCTSLHSSVLLDQLFIYASKLNTRKISTQACISVKSFILILNFILCFFTSPETCRQHIAIIIASNCFPLNYISWFLIFQILLLVRKPIKNFESIFISNLFLIRFKPIFYSCNCLWPVNQISAMVRNLSSNQASLGDVPINLMVPLLTASTILTLSKLDLYAEWRVS